MSAPEETVLATVATAKDRQLVLTHWRRSTKRPDNQWSTENEWTISFFDADGNLVLTVARVDAGTHIDAVYEHKAWDLFVAIVTRMQTGTVFDLGAGPDRVMA